MIATKENVLWNTYITFSREVQDQKIGRTLILGINSEIGNASGLKERSTSSLDPSMKLFRSLEHNRD